MTMTHVAHGAFVEYLLSVYPCIDTFQKPQLTPRIELLTLGTGSDEGVVGDRVGDAPLLVHFIEQLHGQFPVARLLTGTDQAAVGDHAALAPLPYHLLKHLHATWLGHMGHVT